MSSTFPRTRRSRLGYNVDQVEDFLEDARRAYTERVEPSVVTSQSIRHTAFAMQKGGYSPSHVDAALERLEDAFAARERERAFSTEGDDHWYQDARRTAQAIVDRLDRAPGQRFTRVGPLTTGYNVRDVDRFAQRLIEYFQHGRPLGVDDVRLVAFRPAKRGYQEAQVDLLLDAVTSVMLAVR